jgi:ribosomal protein L19E
VWIDPNEVNEISMANSRMLSLSLSLIHFFLPF